MTSMQSVFSLPETLRDMRSCSRNGYSALLTESASFPIPVELSQRSDLATFEKLLCRITVLSTGFRPTKSRCSRCIMVPGQLTGSVLETLSDEQIDGRSPPFGQEKPDG